jgi:hypothetical protein
MAKSALDRLPFTNPTPFGVETRSNFPGTPPWPTWATLAGLRSAHRGQAEALPDEGVAEGRQEHLLDRRRRRRLVRRAVGGVGPGQRLGLERRPPFPG